MPQLTPFYFFNEVTFAFSIILITIYMLSKYILPSFVRLFLFCIFIFKFLKKINFILNFLLFIYIFFFYFIKILNLL